MLAIVEFIFVAVIVDVLLVVMDKDGCHDVDTLLLFETVVVVVAPLVVVDDCSVDVVLALVVLVEQRVVAEEEEDIGAAAAAAAADVVTAVGPPLNRFGRCRFLFLIAAGINAKDVPATPTACKI